LTSTFSPSNFREVINWYSKSYAFVRWGSFASRSFQILAGVRQGNILSPALFAVFIDSMICKLRAAGVDARIGKRYFGCLVNADDILLICHSVTVMQLARYLLREPELMDFSFNTVKSVALRIGPRYRHICAPLMLSGSQLAYVEQTKYLGVMLKSARSFKCMLDHVKVKFYRCFNAICMGQGMLVRN